MTKATKSNNPSIKVAGLNLYEAAGEDAGGPVSSKVIAGEPCSKRGVSKSEIADQIGLHLRSVYDDILAQPVPGRFLELLRQLESASEVRPGKDGM